MRKLSEILPVDFLQIAPRWKTKGYTAIANSLVLNKRISIGAKLVQQYLLIRCFNKDNCFPSYETIAKDLNIGRASVARYLLELKDSGLIKTKRRRNKTNIYFLKF